MGEFTTPDPGTVRIEGITGRGESLVSCSRCHTVFPQSFNHVCTSLPPTRAEFDAFKIELAAVAAKMEQPYPVWETIHADYAKRDAAIAALQADVRTIAARLAELFGGMADNASGIADPSSVERVRAMAEECERIATPEEP